MRFLHLADLHIGRQLAGFSLLDDQRHALAQVLDLACAKQVDAVVIAGDLYDKAQPSAEAVALVDWFLTGLVERGLACLCVAGNHDSAERVAYAGELLRRQGVHVSPVFGGSLDAVTLDDEHGGVTFWLMPYLTPTRVRPFFADEQISQDTNQALALVLATCRIDVSARNVLVAHQFVVSGGSQTLRSDSELSLGDLDAVDAALFDDFDYVALGHVHRPQRVGRDVVRYAGSLLPYAPSEIRYPKSVPLVDLGPKGEVSFELVELEPLHPMRELRGRLEELCDPAVVGGLSDRDRQCYAFVTLMDEHVPLGAPERLRRVYPNLMGVSFGDPADRTSPGDLPRPEDPGVKDPLGLFEDFFASQNGTAPSDEQRAMMREALARAQGPEGSDA
ncbi:exonuclease SbcCD subunit D [Olsenella massiliensis]|uniref:exonuclease SbcCD subunit D n=1 Tax=Olsenella massiliensis TaxID=1622075 RepID=UPI0009EAB5C4|nr:exonuclease SbcCD subunit D [Olsenella massiliensis]